MDPVWPNVSEYYTGIQHDGAYAGSVKTDFAFERQLTLWVE